MTDSLRDRIAAVCSGELCRQQHSIDPDRQWPWLDMGALADAVIRALHPERCCELCGRTGTQKFNPTSTGWVCRSVYACNRRANR